MRKCLTPDLPLQPRSLNLYSRLGHKRDLTGSQPLSLSLLLVPDAVTQPFGLSLCPLSLAQGQPAMNLFLYCLVIPGPLLLLSLPLPCDGSLNPSLMMSYERSSPCAMDPFEGRGSFFSYIVLFSKYSEGMMNEYLGCLIIGKKEHSSLRNFSFFWFPIKDSPLGVRSIYVS